MASRDSTDHSSSSDPPLAAKRKDESSGNTASSSQADKTSVWSDDYSQGTVNSATLSADTAEGASSSTGASVDCSSDMDNLQEMFSRAMRLKQDDGGGERVLGDLSLEGVAQFIASGHCRHIITMVGAGISTSAGIPDFRSPDTGLYHNLKRFNLHDPTAIFTIDFFRENPKPFFVLAKELFPGSFKPTVCHYFLKLLQEKGILLRHYTQNIDTLERVAGIPEEKLVEAHGTFNTSHCLQCRKQYSLSWMKDIIFADEIPMCTEKQCSGIVKPDIVFFGEALPKRFVQCVSKDFDKCDLLIVMGTSLAVQPFSSLAGRVSGSTPRLYINLEKTDSEDDILSLLMGTSFKFNSEDNVRDVFHQSTCDEGCSTLANLLGWGEELRSLVQREHARIDKDTANCSMESLCSRESSVDSRKHSPKKS